MADEVYDGAIGIDLGSFTIILNVENATLIPYRDDIFLRRQLRGQQR